MTIPVMLAKFCPPGLLGIGITALMASFMSGMAGNVTAFNTVWTYDLYQSYIRPGQPDRHYLRMGHIITVVGILISVACAYVARVVQQHHGHAAAGVRLRQRAAVRHVPAGHVLAAGHRPWRVLRAGLAGTLAAALHHGLTLPAGAVRWVSRAAGWSAGTWCTRLPVDMAQNFWDGHLRLDRLFRRDDRGVAGDTAQQDGRRTARVGLFADAAGERARRGRGTSSPRCRRSGPDRRHAACVW